jgi:DNA-binding MurR/RpiR family transcriptional regulator
MAHLTDYDDLKLAIVVQHSRLPKRLRQIAEFALNAPDAMALETVATIAVRADVQPSSLVRFAKHFGFSGFSDMQRVFRSRLVDRAGSYADRIRETGRGHGDPSPLGILGRLVVATTTSLQALRQDVPGADLERAVSILAAADVIGLVAQRRSFPIAAYLAYALSHLERRAVLIDGVGGLAAEQARLIGGGGAIVAVSFSPYAPETLAVVSQARSRGAKIIVITDSPLSPLAVSADVHFEIAEAQVSGIRTLTATNCLAVALVVALGERLERTIADGRIDSSEGRSRARRRPDSALS